MGMWDKKTSSKELAKKRKINKMILGIFLIVVISTLLMKIIDGILLDLGYGIKGKNEFHMYYWTKLEYLELMHKNPILKDMIKKHPHTFWFMTQFTWITTIFIIILLVFRFFKYDGKVPMWLRWVMSQRTLSLVAIYDVIVSVIFWASIYQGISVSFNPMLRGLEITYTVFVHAIIPILMIIYSLIFLINDSRASILREITIWKGMVYPIIYFSFYILIANIWQDPYPITNLNENFIKNVWKLPVAILGFFILIGLMISVHNFILIKFNKRYNPKWDYENEMRKLQIRKKQAPN